MSTLGRVALVTGGGRSVGRGIAEALAADGAAVAVNDLHADRAQETVDAIVEAGGRGLAVPYDVTDRAAIDDAAALVADRLGPIDILVNNAGIAEGSVQAPFLASDEDEWRLQFDLNVFGAMHGIHALAPGMSERGWGRIIQISSGASAVGMAIGVSLYAASKAGIEGLVRHVATELGPTGVTANVLSLGLMENVAALGHPDLFRSILKGVPVGRFGKASEVGAAACWLASEGGAYVTGQVIHVNGGSVNGR